MAIIYDCITLSGELRNLSKARVFLGNFCDKNKIKELVKNQVEIVVDEACANIIEHFYKKDKKKEFTISLTINRKRLLITIESIGKTIDLKYKKINLKQHFSARKFRGLGIYIIYQLMDEVSYHYIPEGHQNVLKLVKKI